MLLLGWSHRYKILWSSSKSGWPLGNINISNIYIFPFTQIFFLSLSIYELSYKKQELFTILEHMISPPVLGGVRVAHLFSFLCCVLLLSCLSSFFVLCAQCCKRLWIVHSWMCLRFSLTFTSFEGYYIIMVFLNFKIQDCV